MLARRSRGLLVGLVALAVTACTSSVTGTAAPPTSVASSSPNTSGQITEPSAGAGEPSASSAPGTSGTAAGAVPASLSKFYTQKLSWGPCASYATSKDLTKLYSSTRVSCARLAVPLAYDNPTGPTISIAVMRKASTGAAAQRIGSAIMDPGGPGGSGLETIAGLNAAKVAANLNTRFDLVGFDPRGVGASLPAVQCQTDSERDAYRLIDKRSATTAQVQAWDAAMKARVDGCVKNAGAAQGIDGKTFLANIGTRDVARDLDVLRGVLGDTKITYIGFSYGTRIGYVYAEEFPTNVRAMILDGVEAPDGQPYAEDIDQNKAFQQAFDSFSSWCAQKDPACPLGQDPGQATAKYRALIHPLLATPLAVTDGRKLSWTDATVGTSQVLYSDAAWPDLDEALHELVAGKGDVMMALADEYFERDSTGHYGSIIDIYDSVRCIEGVRSTSPADVTAWNAGLAAAAPYEATGDPAAANQDVCAFWPVPPTYTPHKLSIPNLSAKPLVISTKGDPATPYQDGVEVAQQLNAALLSVDGTRHTAYLIEGVPCANQVGDAYLINLTLPAAGATCS